MRILASFHVGSEFFVTGILKRSGTPNDRAVFVNMEGFFLLKGHAKPVEELRWTAKPEN